MEGLVVSNIKNIMVGTAFAALATLGGTAANAAVTISNYVGYGTALDVGESYVTQFEVGDLAAGWTLGGTATTHIGTDGSNAAPAFSAVLDDTTAYLSVQDSPVTQFATLTTTNTDIRRMSFYIGSLDTYNYITFQLLGGGTQVFSGSDLSAFCQR